MIQINTNPLVCLAIAALALWSLDRVINPRDLNHLLLMNQSGQDLSSGTLSVEGSRADWNVDFAGCGDGRLSVKNVPHPWSGGTLMIRTDGGQQLAVPIRQPGRYCGTLVLRYSGRGDCVAEWNRLP